MACIARPYASDFRNGGEGDIEHIYVVIADDHSGFRKALQGVIEAEHDMTVAAAVGDGAAALEAIRRLEPDVAVLDVRMPDPDGIDVAREIVEQELSPRTVIMTMEWDRGVFERASSAGARGYLAKETALVEVAAAIRSAARGQTYVAAAVSAASRNP